MNKTLFNKILESVPAEINKLVQKQTEIAIKISQILTSKGIKQKEFASQIGMKESQLSKILAGNANLTLKTITKIEATLEEDIIYVDVIEQGEQKTTLKSDYQEVIIYDRFTQEQKFLEFPDNEYHQSGKIKVPLGELLGTQMVN